ncbi:hypothetical protein AB0E59_38300 [Lentzea sp. NPDC034063]|uniref:Cap15 family cyclic dinucleotide receptor domain-containing protein n=1 Tax=unclassified Lentzea TaxID=2643253 RepID=UPI0033D980B2
MKSNFAIRAIAVIVATVFVSGAWIQGGKLELGWLKFFSIAVLAVTVSVTVWDIWLWRLPLAQLIPGVPRCLRGTWQGVLVSFWINPETGEKLDPKNVYLVIRQTSSKISVTLLTNESRSTSSLADVTTVDDMSQLTYLYLNRPDPRFEVRSKIHHGSTVLMVSGRPAKRLKGHYWTDRDTKGELDFNTFNKQLADDFEEADELFKKQTTT